MSTQSSTSGVAIRFREVTKRYGKRPVLSGLTLDVGAGESLALVGINGAGKTTCIKGLLDFGAVDSGTIEIFGVAHTEDRARARLAFLPERFLPPYYLTGRDFLRYMAKLHGAPYREERVRDACADLDLGVESLGQPAREYSKGMAQKLGLAASFLSGKDLFVLDEPMSGLDPKARLLVKRRLRRHRDEHGSLFFSTHMLADVEELCDRMAILHEGRLVFVGAPQECQRRYHGGSLEEAYLSCLETAAKP